MIVRPLVVIALTALCLALASPQPALTQPLPAPQARVPQTVPDEMRWFPTWTAKPNRERPAMLVVSPDGQHLVSATKSRWLERVDGRFKLSDSTVTVLEGATGRVRARLGRHGEELVAVGFAPGARLLVVSDDARGGQSVTTYETTTWKRTHVHCLFEAAKTPADTGETPVDIAGGQGAFSPDGTRFAGHYGHVEGEIVPPLRFAGRTVVFDTASWRALAEITQTRGADSGPMFITSDDGVLADSAVEHPDRDDEARHSALERVARVRLPFYALEDPVQARSVPILWGPQQTCALSPDGERFVAGVTNNRHGSLLCWDVHRGGSPAPAMRALDDTPRLSRGRTYAALAFSPSGRWLAAGMSDGTVRIWDMQALRLAQETPPEKRGVTALGFSSDEGSLFVGTFDGRVRCFTRR